MYCISVNLEKPADHEVTKGFFHVAVFTILWETSNHALNWILYAARLQVFKEDLKNFFLGFKCILPCRWQN